MKRGFFAAAILMVSAGLSGASQENYGAGSAAAPWLKLSNSARSAGMGEAGVAVADDVNALSVNPAGLSSLKGQQAALMHHIYVLDSSMEHVAYGMGLSEGSAFAVSLDYLNFGSVERFTTSGNSVVAAGSFNPYGMGLNAAYGRSFGPLAAGANLKYVTQSLDTYSSSAFGCDLGGLWRSDWGLSTGLSVQNLGTSMDGSSLPLNFKLGAAYTMATSQSGDSILFAGDVNLPTADTGAASENLGVEYSAASLYAVRGGYRMAGNGGAGGFSVGAGFKFSIASLDYAFVNQGVLGNSNQLSLLLKF